MRRSDARPIISELALGDVGDTVYPLARELNRQFKWRQNPVTARSAVDFRIGE